MSVISKEFSQPHTSKVSDTERELRVQLAAAYRLVDYFGWTELIFGHLTVRVPNEKDPNDPHFLINPYGLNYDEVTASNLVKIDIDGTIVEPSDYPISQAGFVIHSAVHMAPDSDNHCVMHTHTRAGMAIAALKTGLLPISMVSTGFFEQLAYHDYEGVSLDVDERERLLTSLGQHRAMILKNHGLLTTGKTIQEAFIRLYRLERSCQIQLDAMAAGELNILSDAVARKSGAGMDQFSAMQGSSTNTTTARDNDNSAIGVLEFAALMRKLDRLDDSYRD